MYTRGWPVAAASLGGRPDSSFPHPRFQRHQKIATRTAATIRQRAHLRRHIRVGGPGPPVAAPVSPLEPAPRALPRTVLFVVSTIFAFVSVAHCRIAICCATER